MTTTIATIGSGDTIITIHATAADAARWRHWLADGLGVLLTATRISGREYTWLIQAA